MIGKSLRQYVITGRLGQGGMGEVWLARDTTLERPVALKVLPAGDADAATRKERFFREARAASALNHPNIITIYEINSDQGIDFIAMEYVDGRTLGVVLHQGQLPIDLVQRLRVADRRGSRPGASRRHRAPRLEARQHHGHQRWPGESTRLRPGEGRSRAADADGSERRRDGSGVDARGLDRRHARLHVAGTGDRRSRRCAIRCVFVRRHPVRNARGPPPFAGKTLSEVLRELHFSEPPALDSLRHDVPTPLRSVVTQALEKKPDDRFPNMGEVALALSGGTPANAPTIADRRARPGRSRSRQLDRSAGWQSPASPILLLAGLAGACCVAITRADSGDGFRRSVTG